VKLDAKLIVVPRINRGTVTLGRTVDMDMGECVGADTPILIAAPSASDDEDDCEQDCA
jgi:hypothetical protein